MRHSYCCGKPVRRKELEKARGKGYYCERCKRPLTVYGNPKREEDKKEYAEKIKVKGRGHQVLANGGLKLIDKVYPYANEETKTDKMHSEKYVIVDKYARYLTTIMLEKDDGKMYEVTEPLGNRLTKEMLLGIRLSSVNSHGLKEKDLREQKNLRGLLERMGWTFRVNGTIKR